MTSSSSVSPCCSTFRITAPLSFMARNTFTSVIRRFPLLVLSLIPLLFMTINHINKVDGASSSNVLASCPVLQCAVDDNKNKTFFPVHVASDYAQYWDSFYGYNFKIINATSTGEQYVLYQCGSEKPSVGPVTVQSADYQKDGGIIEHTQTVEILPNAKFFSIPLKKVCAVETVPMTFMELLGVRSAIYKTAGTFLGSPCINQLLKDGVIKTIPYDYHPDNVTDCDAVITPANKASPDPKAITFRATADPGVLNRAEYLDYLALFFNKEAASNSVFIPIQNRYNALAEKAKAKSNKKKVAWINGYYSEKYGNSFNFEKAAFKIEYMTNAGLDVFLPPAGSPSSFTTPEELFTVLRENNIEAIFDEAYALKDFDAFLKFWNVTGDDAIPEKSRYLFIKNKMILRYDGLKAKNDAHDWFETAIPNMDAVLTDIVYRFYPDLVSNDFKPIWFRNPALGETPKIIVDECTPADLNSATLPRLDENPGPAGYKCPDWLMNPSLYVPPAPSAAFRQYAINGFMVAAIIIGTLFFH